jgi:hypothetical protein
MRRGAIINLLLALLGISGGAAHARDIGGSISTTLTIVENSQLVDDVTCTVTGAPCIVIGAPNVTLNLNGFTITGQADPQATCTVGPTAFVIGKVEDGIELSVQSNVTIQGPGVVQQFRGPGIWSLNGDGFTATGVTTANNCAAGILVGGGSGHNIADNTSIRNGSRTFACGGI